MYRRGFLRDPSHTAERAPGGWEHRRRVPKTRICGGRNLMLHHRSQPATRVIFDGKACHRCGNSSKLVVPARVVTGQAWKVVLCAEERSTAPQLFDACRAIGADREPAC